MVDLQEMPSSKVFRILKTGSLCSSWKLCAMVLAKPKPGSMTTSLIPAFWQAAMRSIKNQALLSRCPHNADPYAYHHPCLYCAYRCRDIQWCNHWKHVDIKQTCAYIVDYACARFYRSFSNSSIKCINRNNTVRQLPVNGSIAGITLLISSDSPTNDDRARYFDHPGRHGGTFAEHVSGHHDISYWFPAAATVKLSGVTLTMPITTGWSIISSFPLQLSVYINLPLFWSL